MSEVRALLLVDIVDSTALSEMLGDAAMASLWVAHERAARDLLKVWRGREIDKTDGFLLLFEVAADAVGFALAYHHALEKLDVPLQARAGLHVGPVILRENSAADIALGAKPLEVEGLAKPTAARVMSLAQAKQTLLTFEARQALGETSLRLQSHGHWRLKGMSEPVELFEVGDADAPFTSPPDGAKVYRVVRQGERWLPVRQIENNLPQQVTSFIGRTRELAEVKKLVASTRMLTLLGMGGLGKTRLSLQVAADVMYDFADGVWFVELASLTDPDLVPHALGSLLGVKEEAGRSLLDGLVYYVKNRQLLILLDNCEHLVHACASLVDALQRGARDVRIIATSREALRVSGEQTYPVLPLALPDRTADLETLGCSEAVQLFIERAQLQKPEFALTERGAPAVAQLCARLEGIPLALELAAARTRLLSVDQINMHLSDRFKLLTGGSRVGFKRQQTLRALVAWSYDLLQQPEQILLERLSVFAGGFELAAAEQVCGAAPLSPANVFDLLTSLAEKSLIMVDAGETGSRYRMLETIREFGREYLLKRGDLTPTAVRHCNYFLDLAKTARKELQGPDQAQGTRRLETEIDNLRVAIGLALAGEVDPVISVKFSVALMHFWIYRGYSTEGRSYVRAALALAAVQESNVAHAHALYVGGALAMLQSDHVEAKKMLTECLALRRGLNSPRDVAATLTTLATFYVDQDDASKASECDEEALAIFRELADPAGEATGLQNLANICVQMGDEGRAEELFEQCLKIARTIKHQALVAECECKLGELALDARDLKAAQARFASSLKICKDAQNKRGEAIAVWWLGRMDAASGDHDSAHKKFADSLRVFQSFDMKAELLDCLEDDAELLRGQGQVERAVRIYAAAEAARVTLVVRRSRRRESSLGKSLEAARAALGAAVFNAAKLEGETWTLHAAIDDASGPRTSPARLPMTN